MKRKKLSLLLFWLGIIFYSPLAYCQQPLPTSLLTSPSLVFFSLGDQGSGSKAQRQVAAAMEQEAVRNGKPDFILLLGDNFYNNGVSTIFDPQWKDKFEEIYSGLALEKTPFIAVLGNHDHRRNAQAQVQYSKEGRGSKRWQMPDRFFSFDLGRSKGRPLIRLLGLDTTDQDSFEQQARFIRKEFSPTENGPIWRIAAGHHPIVSVGPHGPTKSMHPQILPAMQKSKVHLYLAGHDHNLQILSLPKGLLQVVSGGGGKSLYYIERQIRGMRYAAVQYGFVKVAVSAGEMKIIFFNKDGQILYKTVRKL
jgi:tartrate-resistant acid phosphatase type 5